MNQRDGMALCLSGGGFRATLFHLGACRRINELGLLTRLRSISSVSGGSLLAGFLASRLDWGHWTAQPDPVIPQSDWDGQVSAPVRAFCGQNLRSGPIFATFFRWLPWNLGTPTAVERMAKVLEGHFKIQLGQLPQQPQFIFCATDLNFAAPWTFRRETMGDSQMGRTASDISLGLAVAISACFPPIFLPYRLPTRTFTGGFATPSDQDLAKANLRLNDGGNYDNFGVEAVWRDHDYLLVSDAGARGKTNPKIGWLQLARFMLVVNAQHRALRKRLMMDAFSRGEPAGAYWGVGSAEERYTAALQNRGLPPQAEGFSLEFAENYLGTVRTDMDAFSRAEAEALENHGYTMADVAIKAYPPPGYTPAAFKLPHPKAKSESELHPILRRSRFLNPLGRGVGAVWPDILRGWLGSRD